MRTWPSLVGALLVIAALVLVKSDGVQRGIGSLYAEMFGGEEAPTAAPVCQPGKLVLSARDCVAPKPEGRFAVQTLLEVGPRGVNLPESRRALSNSGVIQEITDQLNASLALPRDIPVQLQQCGIVNAFYDPDAQTITICDEWVDALSMLFADLAQDPEVFANAVLSSTAFVFAHEVGHALIHQFDLKISGREEDVADQFGVYLLAGTPTGAQEVLLGAVSFGRFAESGGQAILWDEHSLDEQRYYNIICWAYGSNPAAFPVVLTDLGLPLARAQRCQDEYRKMAGWFEENLRGHRRSRGLLAQ